MARKPAPALHDVFAKPGAAPSRGTAIEDLPQPPPEPSNRMAEAAVVELEKPAPEYVATPERERVASRTGRPTESVRRARQRGGTRSPLV